MTSEDLLDEYEEDIKILHKRIGELEAEVKELRAGINQAKHSVLFMDTWVEPDSYKAQVDMRKRCYEALVAVFK